MIEALRTILGIAIMALIFGTISYLMVKTTSFLAMLGIWGITSSIVGLLFLAFYLIWG